MNNFKYKIFVYTALLVLSLSFSVFAQKSGGGGGKAEPLRISFKKGARSATVTGNLKGDEEYDFVFGAKANQKIALKIVSLPAGQLTTFKVNGADNDFTGEADNSGNLSFTAPATGDYLVFVQMRSTDKVKSAKFTLSLGIK